MKEPKWIRHDVVLAIHQRQLSEHGGLDGVRDRGGLESALSRPRNAFAYEGNDDVVSLAAKYAYGVAINHPFVDGNKRVALVVCLVFLRLNGVTLNAEAVDLYSTFMELAEGYLSEAQLAEWLRERASSSDNG